MREHIKNLTSTSSYTRRQAADALVNLACNSTNQDAIRDAQGLPPLIG